VVRIVLEKGYSLRVVHIHVAGSMSGIPQTSSRNPKIGVFEYQATFDGIITSTVGDRIPLSGSEESAETLYVAVHAGVDTYTCTC